MSALAALALWITMFLPWYSVTRVPRASPARASRRGARSASCRCSCWLVSLGTLVLLFVRGERRALGAQSADTALLVTILGSIAAVAIFWGIFDRPGGGLAVASGIEWGIVIALLAAMWLAWTGFSVYRRDRGARRSATPSGERGRASPDAPLSAAAGGEPPEAARWVEPSRPSLEQAPRDPPPDREERGERALRRDDTSQLSLELPHDQYDE